MIHTFLPCTSPNIDPEIFFPRVPEQLVAAQAICATCPQAEQCLADALASSTSDGVWGGVLLERGVVVAVKRRTGRPRKSSPAAA